MSEPDSAHYNRIRPLSMEEPEIEHQKLMDAYLAASREHNTAVRAWSAATNADKRQLFVRAGQLEIRLDLAFEAWMEFRRTRLPAHY